MIQYKTMKTNERNFLASRRDFLCSIAALGAVGGCRSYHVYLSPSTIPLFCGMTP